MRILYWRRFLEATYTFLAVWLESLIRHEINQELELASSRQRWEVSKYTHEAAKLPAGGQYQSHDSLKSSVGCTYSKQAIGTLWRNENNSLDFFQEKRDLPQQITLANPIVFFELLLLSRVTGLAHNKYSRKKEGAGQFFEKILSRSFSCSVYGEPRSLLIYEKLHTKMTRRTSDGERCSITPCIFRPSRHAQ